jgi:hypothetical protein
MLKHLKIGQVWREHKTGGKVTVKSIADGVALVEREEGRRMYITREREPHFVAAHTLEQ